MRFCFNLISPLSWKQYVWWNLNLWIKVVNSDTTKSSCLKKVVCVKVSSILSTLVSKKYGNFLVEKILITKLYCQRPSSFSDIWIINFRDSNFRCTNFWCIMIFVIMREKVSQGKKKNYCCDFLGVLKLSSI